MTQTLLSQEATPVPCAGCGGPITETDLGWMHLDGRGTPAPGWLCPPPHMRLAQPRIQPPAPRAEPG